MGRKQDYNLPRAVSEVCLIILGDYERRAQELKKGIKDKKVRENYEQLNRSCERALEEVEPILRKDLASDIKNGRGWEKSRACSYMDRHTYYARKRLVIARLSREIRMT